MPPTVPRLWDLIEEALRIEGARTLHLTVGKPPLVRVSEEGLRRFATNFLPSPGRA
jgi:hypothetical protein